MFYIRSLSEFCESNAKDDAKRNEGLTTPEGVERFDDLRYGKNERHLLDVYCPKNRTGRLPVIVSIHGGGWVYGNKEIMQFYCISLAEEGYPGNLSVEVCYTLCDDNALKHIRQNRRYSFTQETICISTL